MNVNEGHSAKLKNIVSDILGNNASKMLVSKLHSLLDENHQDLASLKNTCSKIEQMVGLFHGPDKAKILNERFRSAFS